MTSTIIFPPYWVYVDLVTMPCYFQSPWQWGNSIFTPLWMRFSERIFKSYFRGGGLVGTLWSLENFWGVWEKNPFFLRGERKKGVLLKGGLCCYFWSFFLRGEKAIHLIHRGEGGGGRGAGGRGEGEGRGGEGRGVAIKWNDPWCWGFKPPILRLFYFFFHPTDRPT